MATDRIHILATVASVAIATTLSVGCRNHPEQTKLQYMPDMADAPTVKAQEDYIDPPPHSVARNTMYYPNTVEEAEQRLTMPPEIKGQEVVGIYDGEKLYETYCTVCHGVAGQGNGTLNDKFPRPPDITSDYHKLKSDGFFFHKITFGSAIMPAYGHSIYPAERWEIVKHIRTLQGK